MGKVVLTQEQVDAIEIFKNNPRDNLYNIAKRKINVDPFQYEYEPFNDMTLDDIAKATYTGYEIEQPKFEVGGWAIRINDLDSYNEHYSGKKPFKINEVKEYIARDENGCGHNFKNIRHATKEEMLWAELGREVGEFRKGDIVPSMFSKSNLYKLNSLQDDVLDAKMDYKAGRLKGFYPAESFKSFPKYWH